MIFRLFIYLKLSIRTSSVGLEKPKCLSKQALLAFHLLKKIAFFTSMVGNNK